MRAFVPNRNLARDLAGSDDYRAGLLEKAEEVRDLAGPMMPRGADERYGHLADQFVALEDEEGAIVGSSSGLFHLAEFGSIHNPPYSPLRRAAMAAGLDVDESGET